MARLPLARDVTHLCVGQIGLRDWQSVRVWPPSRGRLADLLVTTDTSLGSRWCHSRSEGKPSCCYDPCRGSSHSLHSSVDDTGLSVYLLHATLTKLNIYS